MAEVVDVWIWEVVVDVCGCCEGDAGDFED